MNEIISNQTKYLPIEIALTFQIFFSGRKVQIMRPAVIYTYALIPIGANDVRDLNTAVMEAEVAYRVEQEG